MGVEILRTLWQHAEELSGVAILAFAAAVALLAHWLSLRLVLRVPVPDRGRSFLQIFVTATTGPSRAGP